MNTSSLRVLVTGGCGFIGSALIRHLIRDSPHHVLNFDKLTYAGSRTTVAAVARDPRYSFVRGDICNGRVVKELFTSFDPDLVVHLAAESHVDRSIDGPNVFVQTNVVGTSTLLQVALDHFRRLPVERKARFRFHHVSTDEVYGSLGPSGRFAETSPYDPRSPYSATKAASDHLVAAWGHTYGLPVLTSNCSNNYGPYQFLEKLIPLAISKALAGEPIPVYGQGENVRDWLFVDDHARALRCVFEHGQPGQTYNVGGNAERRNIDVVTGLCTILDELSPPRNGKPRAGLITFVTDRPGHDQRYAINAAKIRRDLNWRPRENFESGLAKTVRWYLDNTAWWQRIHARDAGRRLGRAF